MGQCASSRGSRSGLVIANDDFIARAPELRRSPFRLTLGPAGITTGKGLGIGL